MGFNTTIVVMNDALDMIAKDPSFGDNLNQAILKLSAHRERQDVPAYSVDENGKRTGGVHVNAASVIEMHHADLTSLVAVGGNYGTLIGRSFGYKHHEDEDQVKLLKTVANDLGYKLVKNSKAKPRTEQPSIVAY